MFRERLDNLRKKLLKRNIEIALICGDDNIYFYSGYCDFLHMDFGRPTILAVTKEGESILITPSMEAEMAKTQAFVDRVELWNDGLDNEWRRAISTLLNHKMRIGIEQNQLQQTVREFIEESFKQMELVGISDLIYETRIIKSPEELDLARHAGLVADAMMVAGRDAINPGVKEYEVALATAEAGTRQAAKLLTKYYANTNMSPNIHFLQIMASGQGTTMPHHRASIREIKDGEPVFLCFCGMTNFHRFKLGFDRTFWVRRVADKSHEFIYETALKSQIAALKVIKPGTLAEEVHAEYAEVIQTAGFEYPFRCGRATGFSFLEKPQLVFGDKTALQAGMVLAVDGSVSGSNFRAQVGDSIIVTDDGYERLTHHSNALDDVVIR